MSDKEKVCAQLKEEILRDLETMSHKDLLRMKVSLIENIPGSGGIWYQEIALLCSLIDNKIAVDHLRQSAWDRWGRPLLIEVLKAFVVAAIPFAAGLLLGSLNPDLLATLGINQVSQHQTQK